MNFLALLNLLPTILRLVDFVKKTIQGGLSINTIGSILQNPDLLAIFKQLGANMFPDVKPEFQAAAALAATYAPDYVMKVQNAANILLDLKPPLDIDGHYGPLTRAAVAQLQKQLKLEVVDGWVGDKSMAAIQAALLKRSDEVKASIPAPAILKK